MGLVAALLLLVAISVAPHVLQPTYASSKKGKVAVEAVNFRPDEKRVEYTVNNDKTGKTIGHKVFDFWPTQVEAGDKSLSLTISFNTKGLHKNDLISVCLTELDYGDAGYCGFSIKYKPGKLLHTAIDLGYVDDRAGFADS